MKKYIHKGISLMLVMSMSAWCLTGCGSESSGDDNVAKKDITSDTAKVEALLTNKVGKVSETDKKETVFVEMSADGTVTKTTVSNVLKTSGKDNISDYSLLNNITNISGDEKFTEEKEGNIVWENKGKDIKYQGTTTEQLPIDIKITYYLDDKEISAKDLAGKSGKVKIVYKYINNATDKDESFVPFIMLTGMILNEDTFSNVQIDNGKVIENNDSNIVIGYAAPGLKDHFLKTIKNAQDYIGDLEIPEGFTVTADAKDFSMDMALTVATSELGDLDLKETFDFSDIEKQMNKLQDGTNELVDGTKDLNSGVGELIAGAAKINAGAGELAKYTSQLAEGAGKLYKNYKKFDKGMKDGVESAKTGAKKIYEGSKELESAAAAVAPGAKKIESAAGEINNGGKSLANGISTAKKSFEDETNAAGVVKQPGLTNGAKSVAAGAKSANEGVRQLAKTLQDTPDSIQKQIDGVIAQVSKSTGGAISSEALLNKTVEAINSAVESGMDLNTVLTANGLNVKAYYSLLQAYYSVQTLESVKSTFDSQIAAKSADIKTLLTGMEQLESGTATISGGIQQLYTGISQLEIGANSLTDGTQQLSDGTKQLTTGTSGIKSGSKKLTKSLKQLSKGADKLSSELGDASTKIKEGVSQISSASSQINTGAGTLAGGIVTLDNGIITLADGTKQLENGAIKLNDEGIHKITSIFGKDAKDAVSKIEDTLNAGKEYRSFSGIRDGMSGSVKFIFKTDEIKSDN